MSDKVKSAIELLQSASSDMRDAATELLGSDETVENAQRALNLVREIDERRTQAENFLKQLAKKGA